jgi:hypothetical protein
MWRRFDMGEMERIDLEMTFDKIVIYLVESRRLF